MTIHARHRLAAQIHERQQEFDTAHEVQDRRGRPGTAGAPEPKHTVQELLDFEVEWGEKHTGRKDEAIRAVLGLKPARFYQLLGRALDSAAAVAHNPQLTNHLLERRDRSARRR
ncbi:DUF3263 domain-containing protein [Microbacterium rhizophilus]|uniref:DUF3263 domain-containing protein n=1 Tax=Microbacterium rhizophilus TaxID=3138934 RepID=UPI0031F144E9